MSEEDQAAILAGLQPVPATGPVAAKATPTSPLTPALPATSTGASASVADSLSFESFGPWKRGDQPYATFAQSSE